MYKNTRERTESPIYQLRFHAKLNGFKNMYNKIWTLFVP